MASSRLETKKKKDNRRRHAAAVTNLTWSMLVFVVYVAATLVVLIQVAVQTTTPTASALITTTLTPLSPSRRLAQLRPTINLAAERQLSTTNDGTEGIDNNHNNNNISSSSKTKTPKKRPKTVVVIGGGWAGFSAADALCACGDDNDDSDDDDDSDVKVILLDASPRGPGGLSSGWTTSQGRPVEAGIHGFWRNYANVYDTIENRIGLNLDDVLTPYTPSILVSQEGTVAVAPVLGKMNNDNDDDYDSRTTTNTKAIPEPFRNIPMLAQLVQHLPPPLDVALLTEFNDNRLSIADRISGLGLLPSWADFVQDEKESWLRYDKISADQLFRNVARLSPALYTQVVLPLLHVLPMTTAYDCSAAAALSCFHVFALQSRGAFDVRWCRASIGQAIFNPWADALQATGRVELRGSARVTNIQHLPPTTSLELPQSIFEVTLQDNSKISCDAVVLAVGAVSARNFAQSCEALQALTAATHWKRWRGITCVAVRIFLRGTLPRAVRDAMRASPVFVCGPNLLSKQGGEHNAVLLETGFCLYNLSRLQDTFREKADVETVLEVDFFRADALADLKDNDIVDVVLRSIQAALDINTPLDTSRLFDSSVVRARRAVSHFCIGSAALSPPTRLTKGICMCGDWVDRTGHASWSTEKAVVTGRQAAVELAADLQLRGRQKMPRVIPVPPDTPALQKLRQSAILWRRLNPDRNAVPKAPWAIM